MKKYKPILFLSLCFLFFPFITIGQENRADDIIESIISRHHFFELKRLYPKYKEKLNPALRALSETLLLNAHNQTDSTLKTIENLKSYHQDLSFENVMNIIILKSKLLIKKGEYKEAHQLIQNQLKDKKVLQYAAAPTLNQLKTILKQAEVLIDYPKSSIERSQRDCVVPLMEENKIPATINGKEVLFIFDTGADAPAFISQQFAEQHHIKVFEQTFPIEGIATTEETHIGFIDSLLIGNIIYRNFWTLVFPDNKISYNDTIITEVNAVLGRHFMDLVGEIQIFSTENKISFPLHSPTSVNERNIIFQNGQPYIEVVLNEVKTPLHLDTGGGIALYSNYFQENKEGIKKEGIKDILGMAGVGGAQRYPIYIIPSMELVIAGVPTIIEDIPVFTNTQGFSKESYGMIGMDVLSRFYKVILNFKDLHFKIERL